MERPVRQLSEATVLLVNDDGFDAPGLSVLRRVIEGTCRRPWVVAPEGEQSGAGHSLTLQRPLRIRERGNRAFSVDGTPTDCVMLAVNRIMGDERPDLVLSGVNNGTNLGEDLTYSGTVAAAIEGTILGIPSIAFSQDMIEGADADWSVAEAHVADLAGRLFSAGWSPGTLMNVNFPAIPDPATAPIRVVRQGRGKSGDRITEARDPRGRPYYWIGEKFVEHEPGQADDISAVASGAIAVTPVKVDFTDEASLRTLSDVLK